MPASSRSRKAAAIAPRAALLLSRSSEAMEMSTRAWTTENPRVTLVLEVKSSFDVSTLNLQALPVPQVTQFIWCVKEEK